MTYYRVLPVLNFPSCQFVLRLTTLMNLNTVRKGLAAGLPESNVVTRKLSLVLKAQISCCEYLHQLE